MNSTPLASRTGRRQAAGGFGTDQFLRGKLVQGDFVEYCLGAGDLSVAAEHHEQPVVVHQEPNFYQIGGQVATVEES